MLRPTSIFQLVVLPYLRQYAPRRYTMQQDGTGLSNPKFTYRRHLCSSPRCLARSRQKVAYSTLEAALTPWEPPILEGIPWRGPPISPKPPPRRFRLLVQEDPPETLGPDPNGPIPLVRRPKVKPPDEEDHPPPRPSTSGPPRTPETEASRTVQEILDSARRRHIDPEHRDLDPLPSHVRTATIALRKIVDAHQSETERTKREAKVLGLEPLPPPPLPPLVDRLLRQQEYRLAVFHTLRNPHLASSDHTLEILISRLEQAKQGEMANHVQSVMQDTRRFSINNDFSSPDPPPLSSPEAPPGFWDQSPFVPPDPARRYPYTWTDRQKVTHYLNARLAYLGTTPLMHHLTAQDPLLPPIPRRSQRFQNPGPGLHHLRDMLSTIDRYRRRWGFEPDRVTANIILQTWIKCITVKPPRNPYRVAKSRSLPLHVTLKSPSKIPRMQPKDLMVIFRSVSDAILQSIEAIDLDTEKVSSEVDWAKHVRPFVILFQYTLEQAGDVEGHGEVTRWSKLVRKYLGLVRQYREMERGRTTSEVKEAEAETSDGSWVEQGERRRADSRIEYERVKKVLMDLREGRKLANDDGEEESLETVFMKRTKAGKERALP